MSSGRRHVLFEPAASSVLPASRCQPAFRRLSCHGRLPSSDRSNAPCRASSALRLRTARALRPTPQGARAQSRQVLDQEALGRSGLRRHPGSQFAGLDGDLQSERTGVPVDRASGGPRRRGGSSPRRRPPRGWTNRELPESSVALAAGRAGSARGADVSGEPLRAGPTPTGIQPWRPGRVTRRAAGSTTGDNPAPPRTTSFATTSAAATIGGAAAFENLALPRPSPASCPAGVSSDRS